MFYNKERGNEAESDQQTAPCCGDGTLVTHVNDRWKYLNILGKKGRKKRERNYGNL